MKTHQGNFFIRPRVMQCIEWRARSAFWLAPAAAGPTDAFKDGGASMESFWQDIRYGLRMLVKSRGLTILIVITLGLGIGANAAIFSVLNSFLLRPLPVDHPEQLVVPAISHPGNEDPHNMSYLDIQDYRKNSTAFSDFAAYDFNFIGLSADGRADRMTVAYVTGNYFTMLGVQPALGRLLLPSEGQTPGADPVLVLGNKYWKRRFAADPSVVGKSVKVNGNAFTIVGVVPQSFHGTYAVADFDGYLPVAMSAMDPENKDRFTKRDQHSLHPLARLKPGVSLKQGLASLQVVAQQLAVQYPETNKDIHVYLYPERLCRPEPESSRQTPLVASIFMGLVTLVLLLACVNVANILLVRATTRRKELAVRAAMGAGRARLIRQLLTESIMLALLGGAAGALIGKWSSSFMGSIHLPGDLPFRFDFSLDWRVFSYVAAIALLTGILVGLVPALRASRIDLNDALRESGRSLSGGAGRHRLRNILVMSQVAGSLVLMIFAALFVRSLASAQGVNLGFRSENVMNFTMDPAQLGYNEDRGKSFYRQMEERVGAVPGVQSVSLAFSIPLGYNNDGSSILAEGQTLQPGDRGPFAGRNSVSLDYFNTMSVPILRGRAFTAADTESSPPVAVVNQALANKLWPGQDPIGKRFSSHGQKGPYIVVVGLTSNGKYQFIFEDPTPFYYMPFSQDYRSLRSLQVRTTVPPKSIALAVQKEIHSLDPELPVYDVMTMEESLDGGNGFFLLNMGAAFAGTLGVLGLILAVVGVYGVVSYSASQRTNEIGVRMALGAQSADILKLVVSEGLSLVLIGLGIGLAAALGLTRLMANMLFGIKPYDPITYSSAVILLLAVAFVACFIPAHRSTRIDPMVALRYE